jgi:hypothetical protein
MEMAIDRKGHENELSPSVEGNNDRRPVRDGTTFSLRWVGLDKGALGES